NYFLETTYNTNMYYYDNLVEIDTLKGKILTEIEKIEDHTIRFNTADGEVYEMLHIQDCCEDVRIEDIVGDLNDLIGSPITEAEEVVSHEDPKNYAESYTWTFYKLGTAKGHVTIRWYGESNGYYSESVDFLKK